VRVTLNSSLYLWNQRAPCFTTSIATLDFFTTTSIIQVHTPIHPAYSTHLDLLEFELLVHHGHPSPLRSQRRI
jgi:hypothetical protein